MVEYWSNNDRGYRTRLWIDQTSQNISGNSSQVRVRLALLNTTTTFTQYSCNASVTVNGQNLTWSGSPSVLSYNQTVMLIDQTITVGHNADGTKSFSLSSSFKGSGGYSPGTLTIGSKTFTLTTIPRASSVSAVSGTIGTGVSISISRQSSSFTHTVRYAFGNQSGTIASNVATSCSWTIPTGLANEIPNSTIGTGTIYVDTYSGSTKTGTKSATLTAAVPDSLKPTFIDISLTDGNTVAQNLIGENAFLQIISNIKVTFNGAMGIHGSSITGYKAEIVGKNQSTSENGGSLGIMKFNGTVTIRASVFDSRGRESATRDVAVTVLEYFAPVLKFDVTRSGSTSSTFTINRNAKVAPLTISGSQKNSMTLSFKVAPLGSTTYTNDTGPAAGAWTTLSSLTNSKANLSGVYVGNKSWTVVGTLTDKFTKTEFALDVATESVVFSYDQSGMGIAKIRERGALDVAGDGYIEGKLEVKTGIFVADKPIQQHQITTNEGYTLSSSETVDFNTKVTTGIWWLGSGSANNPFGQWGLLEVFRVRESNLELIQRFTTTQGYVAVREHDTATTWRPWRYVAQQSESTANKDHESLSDTGWLNIPNSWLGPGSSWTTQGRYRVRNGVVSMVGRISNNGMNKDTTTDVVLLNIPSQYRPISNIGIVMTGASNTAGTISSVYIQTGGEVMSYWRANTATSTYNFNFTYML